MSKNKFRKIPFAKKPPSEDKTPRAVPYNGNCPPEFRTDQMDLDGPWGWNKFDPFQMKKFLSKIFYLKKLSWQELRKKGSHSIKVSKIILEAQKRLRKIKKDDLDDLYSLRLTGEWRILGIKDGNVLWFLWWDPEHEVCPTSK